MSKQRKAKQPRLPKVIRVGTRKPAKKNREQTSARVAQAAGRLLNPDNARKHVLTFLKAAAKSSQVCNMFSAEALIILAMLRDGVTVAGSALTQRPNKGKR